MIEPQLQKRVRTSVVTSFEKRDDDILMVQTQQATNLRTGLPVDVRRTENIIEGTAADMIDLLEAQKTQKRARLQSELTELDVLIAQLAAL